LVSRPIITWRSSVDFEIEGGRRGDGRDDVADRDRHVDDLALRGAARLDPGQGQQRLGQTAHPVGVVGQAGEEVIAVVGVVLGAPLEDLDRPGDAGQGVAQLVGGVGDEVGFGELATQLVGAVAEHRQDGPLVGQRARGHRVGAVADPQRRVGREAQLRGPVQLRQDHLRRLAGWVQQA
jgi:hypothetical protein